MSIVGLNHRRRRIRGTMLGVAALAALVVPSAQASGPAFKPAILDVTGWKMGGTSAGVPLAGAPLPASGDRIGPGSYLLIHRTDGDFICTANFVWQGSDGNTYLGAAGHCFLPPEDETLAKQPKVQVCIADCAFGGQLGTVIQGQFRPLGDVAFARQSIGDADVGNDFGIVKIPPTLLTSVHRSVPVWGGPSKAPEAAPALGRLVCLYGNAGGLGEVFATKARFGIGGESDADSWFATIPSAPGDSGAAVVNCPNLSGGSPAGILTHLATNGTGVIAGTTITRAQAMVKEASVTITLLT